MRPLLALLLLAHGAAPLAAPAGLSKTERNLLGYLPTEAREVTGPEAPALKLGCDGEPATLVIEGQRLRFTAEGEETELAIDKVEATNAGWGLRLSRTGADKREPLHFAVELTQLDKKRGLWRLSSDPDGLASGSYQAVLVDARQAARLPRRARPARDCQ